MRVPERAFVLRAPVLWFRQDVPVRVVSLAQAGTELNVIEVKRHAQKSAHSSAAPHVGIDAVTGVLGVCPSELDAPLCSLVLSTAHGVRIRASMEPELLNARR